MTIGSTLLTIALIIMLLLYLLRPFLTPTTANQPTTPRQKLLADKEKLLDHIRALDFDHTTGKIPDEVYQAQRYHFIREAAVITQQLDSHTVDPANIETAIETAVARLRQQQPPTTITPTPAPPPNGKPGQFCPQCGQRTAAHDKFCASCGHKLQEVMNN